MVYLLTKYLIYKANWCKIKTLAVAYLKLNIIFTCLCRELARRFYKVPEHLTMSMSAEGMVLAMPILGTYLGD